MLVIEDVAAGGNNEDTRTPDIERRYDRIRAANNDKRDQDGGAVVGGRAEENGCGGGGGVRFCNWCHIVVDNVDKVSFP